MWQVHNHSYELIYNGKMLTLDYSRDNSINEVQKNQWDKKLFILLNFLVRIDYISKAKIWYVNKGKPENRGTILKCVDISMTASIWLRRNWSMGSCGISEQPTLTEACHDKTRYLHIDTIVINVAISELNRWRDKAVEMSCNHVLYFLYGGWLHVWHRQ